MATAQHPPKRPPMNGPNDPMVSEETENNPSAPSENPEDVRALARETLAWCRDNPTDPEALHKLNTVLQLVHDPVLGPDVIAASEAVTRPAVADQAPSPAVHAHMTVLVALLLEYEPQRDAVDAIFVAWLRNPGSYGGARATPPAFQKQHFVQRLADLLGWGTLDVQKDKQSLARFAAWVNTWTPKNKHRARRAIEALRRNFEAPDVWKVIRIPETRGPG